MKFSIVTCSRNRADRIPSFLDAIGKLDYPKDDWELTFVDNGSTDNTREVFDEHVGRIDIRSVYTQENKPGVNSARNTGVAVAKHDVLVFTADDCYVSQDLLRQYQHDHERHEVGFIGGQVRPEPSSDVRLSIQERGITERIDPHTFLRAGLIHGANMSIRRRALLDGGMFDPRFGPGADFPAGSEVDTLARIIFAGWRGLYPQERHRLPDPGSGGTRPQHDLHQLGCVARRVVGA